MATVTSVTEGQQIDTLGNTTDTYVIAFTAGNPPGAFTVEVPTSGDAVAAAKAAIDAIESTVTAIYAL